MYGLNPATGRYYNADAFELEMRWRLQNRGRAVEEDQRILEQAGKAALADQ